MTPGALADYGCSLAAAPSIREPLHAPVAHLVRGGVIEGIHYGSVVVLAADGSVELQIGDIEAAFYPARPSSRCRPWPCCGPDCRSTATCSR